MFMLAFERRATRLPPHRRLLDRHLVGVQPETTGEELVSDMHLARGRPRTIEGDALDLADRCYASTMPPIFAQPLPSIRCCICLIAA
jgi:hypothetical protein